MSKSKNVMIEDTYQQKLKNTTNLRLFAFFLWKFILMAIFSYVLNYILFLEAIKSLNWKFYLVFNPTEIVIGKSFFLKVYALSTIINWLSIIYYQKYEESLSKTDYFLKLFFWPNYNIIFFFVNFFLTTIFLTLFEHTFNSDRLKNQKINVIR